jgi:hypothetical protein
MSIGTSGSTGASRRDWLVATLVVVATGVVSTWPLATSPWLVPDHQDPLFSSWRLYQWARNLSAFGAGGLFSGNMFHPAPDVLLYSDALLLPALIGAPFILAGVPVVVVYNGLVWLSMLSAGLAMYACARHLSGSHFGALVAAVMFVGAPLRLDHVMHLELLCTAFLPLTVLATARVIEGSTRAAWGLGASLTGQFLSCIYYGVFVVTVLPVLVVVEWLRRRNRPARPVVWRTGVSLVAAATVLGAYALQYQQARRVVGERSDSDVDTFSGSLDAYLVSPPTSRLWGWTSTAGQSERWLFPGLVGSALAVSAVTAPAAPWTAALAAVTVVGADASRGSSGLIYPLLRRVLPPYRGLRVPSRFGMLVLTAWALLAAIGSDTLARTIGKRPRAAALAGVVLALMIVESAAVVDVRRLPATAPPIYSYLAALPPTVLAHAPWPAVSSLPGFEADFIYFAQYHRHRIVNGNSGFYPPSYLEFLERAWNPSSDQTMDALRTKGVEYLLVHERYFPSPAVLGATVFRLEQRRDLQPVGTYADEAGRGDVRMYRLTR